MVLAGKGLQNLDSTPQQPVSKEFKHARRAADKETAGTCNHETTKEPADNLNYYFCVPL